MTNKAGAS